MFFKMLQGKWQHARFNRKKIALCKKQLDVVGILILNAFASKRAT